MENEEFYIKIDLLLKLFYRTIVEKSEIVKKQWLCPEIINLTSDHKDKNGKYVRQLKIFQYDDVLLLADSKNN